ncbi:MAG: TlpA disulfide reductase family protein [Myxococcota bacterium]|nr:TlpA disulfide reductase family protein [Myxococcota bacterium]
MKKLREWLVFLVFGSVLFHCVGRWRAPDLPAIAPDFTLQDLDGDIIRLANLRGRPVILNFWATWCGPCRFEIPSFSSFSRAHPEVVVLGVAVDGTVKTLTSAVKDLGINYPVLRGHQEVQSAYGVQTLPTTVMIGPDGRIVSAHTGIMFRPQLEWMLLSR